MTSTFFRRPHPSVVFTELDDQQAALLHLDTKRYYSLNESGCLIWQLLARGLDEAAIATELQREYEITDEACREQVAAFLAVLEAEGLAAP